MRLERTRRNTWIRWLGELWHALGGHDHVNCERYFEAAMEWVWRCTSRLRCSWTQRCTCRPRWSEVGGVFGGRGRDTQRFTWTPWWSEFGGALGGQGCVTQGWTWRQRSWNLEVHLEAVSERVWKCPRRQWSSYSEMHLEAVIDRVWGCTWTVRSCTSKVYSKAVIGRVWTYIRRPSLCNSNMHLVAVIEQVWRCYWRPGSSWKQKCTSKPWSRVFREALGGQHQVTKRCTCRPRLCNSEMQMEAVIERDWRRIWRP